MTEVAAAELAELYKSLRSACPKGLWARGVKLAREGAVTAQSRDRAEWVLLVADDAGKVARTVVLYPGEIDWECDCDATFDACAHTAAAVVATKRAADEGVALTSATEGKACVVYEFRRAGLRLTVGRGVDGQGGRRSLNGPLAAADTSDVFVESRDHELDRLLPRAANNKMQPAVPPARWPKILEALEGAQVTLDGRTVNASRDPLFPHAVVQDHGYGVRISVTPSTKLDEVIGFGVGLVGDTLRPLGATELTGLRLEKLPLRRTFDPDHFAELSSDLLPQLRQHFDVDIQTNRLPEVTARVPPRIDLQIDYEGDTISVLPVLVYGDPAIARVDGDRLVHVRGDAPLRDRAAERKLLDGLRELNLVPGRCVDYRGAEARKIAAELRRWQGEQSLEGLDATELEPVLRVRGGEVEVQFARAGAGRRGPPGPDARTVVDAWSNQEPLIALPGGGWGKVPADWLDRCGSYVRDLLAAKSATAAAGFGPALALCRELDVPPPPKLAQLRKLADDFDSLPAAELPADLSTELRGYQRIGVNWLAFLRSAELGGILADDMGLGKTVQTLCAVRRRSLVVCPRSVVFNWLEEAARFRPDLKVARYHGPRRKLDRKADLTVTSYGVLRADIDELEKVPWDVVGLDEAQAIKNRDSQVARAAYRLRGKLKLALSGTPIENRLDELWSLSHFSNPGLLGEVREFRERYADKVAAGNDKAAAALRTKLRPFLLRRTKSEVASELPPKTETVLWCELDQDERDVYDAIKVAARADLVEKMKSGGVMAALEALLRLRQAACHRALLPNIAAESSTKLDRLMHAIETAVADEHKCLVFSQWTSLLDLVEPHLERAGLSFCRLDGKTRNREQVVSRFQSKSGPPVFIASLKAGGSGLNLTAADSVFILDPWWNPAVERQAADRTHRIGQDKPVTVYRLVARDTVEERVLALQKAKQAVADAALAGGGAAGGLTKDDLLALLE